MAAMAMMLLFPTRRILRIVWQPMLSVYADDRRAITTSDGDMERIQAVWTEAETCSALQDNEDTRVRW
eukprot:8333877-Alexandrium_andersonii.AAC.1